MAAGTGLMLIQKRIQCRWSGTGVCVGQEGYHSPNLGGHSHWVQEKNALPVTTMDRNSQKGNQGGMKVSREASEHQDQPASSTQQFLIDG